MKAIALLVIAVVAPWVAGGCSGAQKITIDKTAPFVDPPVRFETIARNHSAVFVAPTGGWRIEHNFTRRVFQSNEVFVTLRRPAPGAVVSQAQSEHAIDTGVEATKNILVYARIVTGRDAPGDAAYRLAGEVTPDRTAR